MDNKIENTQQRKFEYLQPREIALCIIFTIITCGIYGWYWIYKMNEEINEISGHPEDTSGGLVILFSIITCGIYNIYWCYKMGQKLSEYYESSSVHGDKDLGILFLILMLASFFSCSVCGFVCYGIMQDNINKIVR